MKRHDSIATEEVLRACGLRATPARLAMWKALQQRDGPCALSDLRASLPRTTANPSTAYRVVHDFLKAGLLRRIPSSQGLYERADLPHHHHLICVRCGRIEDIPSCGVEGLVSRAVDRSKRFKKVVGHALEVFAVCTRCRD